MTSLEQPRALALSGAVVEAAGQYERILAENPSLDAYVDLAVLYWRFNDYGFASYHGIDVDLQNSAWLRVFPLLEEARERYLDEIEPEFWLRYIKEIGLGGSSFIPECLALVEAQPDCLVPYFYLHIAIGTDRYANEVARLVFQCRAEPSPKHEYILAVLQPDATE